MSGFDVFKWLVAVLSLVGVVLNIRKRPECFAIWTGTNAAWVVVDVAHGVYPQAILQALYCLLSVWGLIEWRRKK